MYFFQKRAVFFQLKNIIRTFSRKYSKFCYVRRYYICLLCYKLYFTAKLICKVWIYFSVITHYRVGYKNRIFFFEVFHKFKYFFRLFFSCYITCVYSVKIKAKFLPFIYYSVHILRKVTHIERLIACLI